MLVSRSLVRALVFTALAAPAVSRAAVEIRNVDLGVQALVPGEGRRAPWPSHKVFVGDRAGITGLVYHDGSVQGFSTSFTTTAPVTNVYQHPAQGGLLTGPFEHQIPFGSATFTTPGRYKLDLHFRGGGADATASFDIEVVQFQAVQAPAQVSVCLAPAVRWVNPAANGALCLNKPSTLTVSPTFHGCNPYTVEILEEGSGGKWAVLATKTAAPWSVSHTFTAQGPVHLKAIVRDRNGGTGESEITANVGECLDASRFKH
jgi:hypothetical protein